MSEDRPELDMDAEIRGFLEKIDTPSEKHISDPQKDIQSKLHALGFKVHVMDKRGATEEQLKTLKERSIGLLRGKYPQEEGLIKELVKESDMYGDMTYLFDETEEN